MPKLKCDCGKVYTLTDDMMRVRAGKKFTCSQCGTSRKLPLLDSSSQGATTPETEPELPPIKRKSTFIPLQSLPAVPAPDPPIVPPVPRVGFECPYCHSRNRPTEHSKISAAGWVVFVVLLLFCFPLCLIALFITEKYRVAAVGRQREWRFSWRGRRG